MSVNSTMGAPPAIMSIAVFWNSHINRGVGAETDAIMVSAQVTDVMHCVFTNQSVILTLYGAAAPIEGVDRITELMVVN